MSDITDLVIALGGDAHVLAFYDCRTNVNTSGATVTSINDARGSVGFGPNWPAVGTTKPAYNSTTKDITLDAVDNGFMSAVDAKFDPTAGRTVLYVGDFQGSTGWGPVLCDNPLTKYIGFDQRTAAMLRASTGATISMASPRSSTRRPAFFSVSPVAPYGGGGIEPHNVQLVTQIHGRPGRNAQYLIDNANPLASGSWRLNIGYFAGAVPQPAVIRAVIVLDRTVSGTEWAAFDAWAIANHTAVPDNANTRLVFFDGNSLMAGFGGTAGQDPPAIVMADASLSTNCDYVQGGLPSVYGATMLSWFASRVAPAFKGNHAKKVYVAWEITNDIIGNGLTGAQAAENIRLGCVAAKAAGATATVAVLCLPRTSFSGAQETQRLAANAILRALPAGIDRVVDVAAIANLTNATNGTYFQPDGTHLQNAGSNSVALDASNGFLPALTYALTLGGATKVGVTRDASGAASGIPFDFQPITACQDAGGVTQTAETRTLTASLNVIGGAGVLSGAGGLSLACVAGVADWNNNPLKVTGTGRFSITIGDGVLISATTAPFDVVAPVYFKPIDYGNLYELPREKVNFTTPTPDIVKTLGPGKDYTTVQAAIDAAGAMNGNVRFLCDPVVFDQGATHVTLKMGSATGGWVEFRSTAVGPSGVRVGPSMAGLAPKLLSSDTTGSMYCLAGAHHYRWTGWEFESSKPGFLINDMLVIACPGSPTTIAELPHDIIFDRCWGHAAATQELKRGLGANGLRIGVIDSDFNEIHHLATTGGDSQALASWIGSTVTAYNSRFYGGTEAFLTGGVDISVPDFVPSDFYFEKCVFGRPQSYRTAPNGVATKDGGNAWSVKNTIETKSARRMHLKGCIIENSWTPGQSGGLVNLSATQGGTNPWVRCWDVVLEDCVYRNATGDLISTSNNGTGAFPTQGCKRVLVHNAIALNIGEAGWVPDADIWRMFAFYGDDITVNHVTCLAGTAGARAASFPFSPAAQRLVWKNGIMSADLGISGSGVGPNGPAIAAGAPSAVVTRNAFINLYGQDAAAIAAMPGGNFFPATMAAIGFTNLAAAQAAWLATTDLDALLSYLILAPGSSYKAGAVNQATDGTDLGADIPSVRASIAGAYTGNAGADHLAVTRQPSATTVSGAPHAVQPAITVQDLSNAPVAGDTSTVAASLVVLSGFGTPIGTLTKAAVAALADFAANGLGVNGVGTFKWHFTDGALTSVDSAAFTIAAGAIAYALSPTRLARMHQTRKQGDTGPPLVDQLLGADGTPQDLTGASVRLNLRSPIGALLVTHGVCSIVAPLTGSVLYVLQAGDLAVAGSCSREYEATLSDGTVISFPNDTYGTLLVTKQLA